MPEELPPWTDWDDRTRMRMIAFYRHWFLFNEGGKPHVVKRRKVSRIDPDGTRHDLCDEEVCDLESDSDSMTADARASLRLAWIEYTQGMKV